MAYMELSGTLFDHTRSKDEISGSFSLSKFLPRNSEMTGAWMRKLLVVVMWPMIMIVLIVKVSVVPVKV